MLVVFGFWVEFDVSWNVFVEWICPFLAVEFLSLMLVVFGFKIEWICSTRPDRPLAVCLSFVFYFLMHVLGDLLSFILHMHVYKCWHSFFRKLSCMVFNCKVCFGLFRLLSLLNFCVTCGFVPLLCPTLLNHFPIVSVVWIFVLLVISSSLVITHLLLTPKQQTSIVLFPIFSSPSSLYVLSLLITLSFTMHTFAILFAFFFSFLSCPPPLPPTFSFLRSSFLNKT